MTAALEFSRPLRLDTLPINKAISVEANAEERTALALRFDLVALDNLSATLTLKREGEAVTAKGELQAVVTQSCVASGEPVLFRIAEPFEILFRPEPEDGAPDEEIELSKAECDVVFYQGAMIDIGEAMAETLALALDPWPRAPGAEDALREAGVKTEEEAKKESSPFAGLAALKKK